jgi:hypothetical protein
MRMALKLSPMKASTSLSPGVLLPLMVWIWRSVVAVAGDDALEVSGFVENGGEEVVVAVGEAVGGGAVGGVG